MVGPAGRKEVRAIMADLDVVPGKGTATLGFILGE